ncbi:MAG: hypothetical protein PUB00_09365, partial [Clostridiales bacterium]|nr:hypothetical protein [Clostridiales bacterium]
DWELVIPISTDMYINKAWNGEVEFSQFGGQNTDKFNTTMQTMKNSRLQALHLRTKKMYSPPLVSFSTPPEKKSTSAMLIFAII